MYNLNHIASHEISRKIQNYQTAIGVSNERFNCFEVSLVVSYNRIHLEYQASVFAEELLLRSNLRFRDILRTNRSDTWSRLLAETYIYSYAKGLHYGLFINDVHSLPQRSLVFVGHGVLQRWISYSRFVFTVGDFNITYNLSLGPGGKSELSSKILNDFPFLDGSIKQLSNGCFEFSNNLYDAFLINLANACDVISSKQTTIVDDSNNVFNNKTETSSNNPDPKVKKVDIDSRVNKGKDEFGNFSDSVAVSRGSRVVEIYELSDPHIDSFMTPDFNPIGNSALSLNDCNKWFYIYQSGSQINNSINYHINRANFICLDEENNGHVLSNGESVYNSLPREFKEDFLLCKDVYAITNLNVSRFISFSPDKSKTIDSEPFVFSRKYILNSGKNRQLEENFTSSRESNNPDEIDLDEPG